MDFDGFTALIAGMQPYQTSTMGTQAVDSFVIRSKKHDVSLAETPFTQVCTPCGTACEISKLVALQCLDYWCDACLERRYRLALKDETMYPPRCCLSAVLLKDVKKHLPKALVRELQARQLELNTKDKTYCHKPTCSEFIAPHSIHNNEAICQKCNARTCKKCRAKWHFGPCSAGDAAAFMQVASSNDWKRCPTCRRMVEKADGCNHMM